MNRARHLRLLGLLVLAGCAGQGNAPSLFVLDNPRTTQDTAPAARHVAVDTARHKLGIAELSLTPYLETDGIVYQTGPHRIVIASNNRWASPLSTQLKDSLRETLATGLPGLELVDADRDTPAYRLVVSVDRFSGHYDGSAHIAGHWQLLAPGGKSEIRHAFQHRIPLTGDGYTALVTSLANGWQAVGQNIVRALGKILEQPASHTTMRIDPRHRR